MLTVRDPYVRLCVCACGGACCCIPLAVCPPPPPPLSFLIFARGPVLFLHGRSRIEPQLYLIDNIITPELAPPPSPPGGIRNKSGRRAASSRPQQQHIASHRIASHCIASTLLVSTSNNRPRRSRTGRHEVKSVQVTSHSYSSSSSSSSSERTNDTSALFRHTCPRLSPSLLGCYVRNSYGAWDFIVHDAIGVWRGELISTHLTSRSRESVTHSLTLSTHSEEGRTLTLRSSPHNSFFQEHTDAGQAIPAIHSHPFIHRVTSRSGTSTVHQLPLASTNA